MGLKKGVKPFVSRIKAILIKEFKNCYFVLVVGFWTFWTGCATSSSFEFLRTFLCGIVRVCEPPHCRTVENKS